MWHQRGDVLQGGDGEGWHGTSPGADQDEEGQRGGENGLMWRTTSKPYYCSGEAATSTQKDLPAAVGSLCGHRGDLTTSSPSEGLPVSQVADLGLVVTWDRGNRVSVRLRPQWANRVGGRSKDAA